MGTCSIAPVIVSLAVSITQADRVDFARDIAPILERHCIQCHNPANEKGDVSLTTLEPLRRGEFVVPGEPDDSELLALVVPRSEGKRPRMPKKGRPLSAEQVGLLRQWIAQGANWPEGLVLHEPAKADRTWWSLQPLAVVDPPMPDAIPDAWKGNPIDRFIFAGLVDKGLHPSAPADRRTLIRRLTYDLHGLPPTPEQLEAFVGDTTSDAYDRLVDRLLASPHYGERWGRHWLDVIRFGESTGFERNIIVNNAWPFRDYVIRSFNDDKPYNRLVLEHLAGDVMSPDESRVQVGTAFLACGPYDNVGNQDVVQAAQIRANTIDDMIRAVGETFLGLTVGCARCHDHKFDPVVQADYYSWYASLAGVHHGSRVMATAKEKRRHATRVTPLQAKIEKLGQDKAQLEKAVLERAGRRSREYEVAWTRPPTDRTGTEEVFTPIKARFVRFIVSGLDTNPRARTGFRIEEFEVWTAEPTPRNVALETNGGQAEGASRVAEDFDDAYSSRLTIDGRFGACWLAAGSELTITLAQAETINRVLFSSDRSGAAQDNGIATFVSEYRIEVSLDGRQWNQVADSSDRRPVNDAHRHKRLLDLEITADERRRLAQLEADRNRVRREMAAIPPLPSWWVGQFRRADGPFHVFVGGNPQRKGKPVVPSSLSTFRDVTAGYQLSADAPEHERRRALAEWIVAADNPLTPRVLANRLWHYHFGVGIVDTPSDFGYMGGRPTHPELLDWLARQVHAFGWRLKPLHKLIVTSQTYRQSTAHRPDAARVDADSRYLSRFPPRRLSGEELRDTMLAVAGKLDATMGGPGFRLYRYLEDNVATYVPRDRHGPETFRRAVYHQNARAARVDLMSEFDCPDNAFAAPRRDSTTTPLQALTLMNHSFTLEMARFLAERLAETAGDDRSHQVRHAFMLAYSRKPTPGELDAATRLIEQHGLRAFCRALLNSNELIYLN